MMYEIREILRRSRATMVEDALGVVALFVVLFAGLSLSAPV